MHIGDGVVGFNYEVVCENLVSERMCKAVKADMSAHLDCVGDNV